MNNQMQNLFKILLAVITVFFLISAAGNYLDTNFSSFEIEQESE